MCQAKKAVRICSVHTIQCTMYTLLYSVHIVQTVQRTQCTHPLLETSPAVLCTHNTAKLLSHVEAVTSSGLGLSHRRARRRTIYRKPCNAVRGVLRPSVAPIHLVSQAFPGVEGVGEQPLPGVGSVALVEAKARLPSVLGAGLAL